MRERLCRTFKHISFKVWNILGDSQYYGYYQISHQNITRGLGLCEETISDLILLELSKRHPYDVISIKFNKRYEAQEGADWEWWILSQSGIVGLRLQAKRLHVSGNSYEYKYLDYRQRSTNKYQVDILIQRAQNMRMIPLYMFFNWWDIHYKHYRYMNNNIPSCCKVYTRRNLGITIASAIHIRNLVYSGKKALSDVLPLSYPLYCLACCSYSDLSKSILTFLREFILKESEEYVHDKLPNIVHSRLEGKFDENLPLYTVLILDLECPHKEIDKIREKLKLR